MSLPEVPVIGVWGRSRHDNAMLINAEREPVANEDPDLAESQIYSDRVREPLIPRTSESNNGSASHSYNLSENKNFVYFAFYLMGMATLLPWNFFITANDYWMYKLRDLDTNQTHNATDLSNLQASFTSYLCITSLIPSTLILWLNAIIGHRFTFKTRIVGGLVAVNFFFALTTVFVKINTDHWQRGFFGLTLATAILLNGTGAMFQGGVFALVGKFPPRYVSAVVSGQALGGLFASAANLTSIALGASAVQSAFLYFLAADITLVLTLVCYIVVANTQYFRAFSTSSGVAVQQIYDNPAINEASSEKYYQESDDSIVVVKEISCGMIRKIWTYAVSMTAIFMVTLSIFPSVTERVRPMDPSHSVWNDLYYTPVACFLIMNVGDYVGRVLAGYFDWPKPGSPMVPTLSFMRMAFIPLVMLCNVQPRHHLPLLLPWDAAFMVIMALFSLSNGYLNTVCFMHAPELVQPGDQEKASSFMAAMLGLGLALGGTLSNLMVRIV